MVHLVIECSLHFWPADEHLRCPISRMTSVAPAQRLPYGTGKPALETPQIPQDEKEIHLISMAFYLSSFQT